MMAKNSSQAPPVRVRVFSSRMSVVGKIRCRSRNWRRFLETETFTEKNFYFIFSVQLSLSGKSPFLSNNWNAVNVKSKVKTWNKKKPSLFQNLIKILPNLFALNGPEIFCHFQQKKKESYCVEKSIKIFVS